MWGAEPSFFRRIMTCAYLGAGWDLEFVNHPEFQDIHTFICIDGMPKLDHYLCECIGYKFQENFFEVLDKYAIFLNFTQKTTYSGKNCIIYKDSETNRKIFYYYNTDILKPLRADIKAKLIRADTVFISGFYPEDAHILEYERQNPGANVCCAEIDFERFDYTLPKLIPNAKKYLASKNSYFPCNLRHFWRKSVNTVKFSEYSPNDLDFKQHMSRISTQPRITRSKSRKYGFPKYLTAAVHGESF